MRKAARDVACPVCFSPPGRPCTQATETGRVNVTWYHYKREEVDDD